MRTSFPLSPTGLCALLMLAPLGLAAAPAQAQTTINFNSLTALAQANNGVYGVGPSYSAQGFTFTNDSYFVAFDGNNPTFGDGQTSLYSGSNFTTLMQDNGQAFSFNAIDLGPLAGNTLGTTFAGPVMFTGTRADGTTVTATQTTTSGRYQTFSFNGFTGLTSLTFSPVSGLSPQFDNVVVTPAPVPEASTTVSLGLLLALGGLAMAVRKKKACASV